MQAKVLLHRWLGDVLPFMHAQRRKALGAVISGVFRSGRLGVTSIGRAIGGLAKEKHNIKRADRLFSNEHLQAECTEVYMSLARQALAGVSRPIILVDWSDIDARRKFFLLRAATPVQGRSLTIYEEIHDFSTKEKRATHKAFLLKLKQILPPGCTPIIITDAGFRTPWFKEVVACGWDYVGRVRNREKVKLAENKPWIGAKSLYENATKTPKSFENSVLTRSNPMTCSLVLYKSKRKGRVSLGKMGKKKRNRTSLVASARAREPWLLASSLTILAEKIVTLYATRMQIEEAFRDLKCPRFGLSLYLNGTYKIARMRILVLLGSITAAFAWLIGKSTELSGQHRHFQANTTTSTKVLSTIFIGIQVFRDWRMRILTHLFQIASKQLSMVALRYAKI